MRIPALEHVIIDAYEVINQANCVEDILDMMEFLQDEVQSFYPDIPIKPGCCLGCTGQDLVVVSAAEWSLILYFIRELPQIVQGEIVRRAYAWMKEYRDIFLLLQQELKSQARLPPAQRYQVPPVQALKEFSCPFQVGELCGIYPVRPARSRAYGTSLIKIGDVVRFLTTAPEMRRWEAYFKTKKGDREVTMPLWNVFTDNIHKLNSPQQTPTILPIWLYTHVENGKLVEDVNDQPVIF